MTPDTSTSGLRAVPSLTGTPPRLDVDELPEDPLAMFGQWLGAAIDADVPEPLAMTLATADADGLPDARTLILKAFSGDGFAFAGMRSSTKGQQLRANPAAALAFWWQPIARAVRVRGQVVEASRADARADLAARSPAARAGVDEDDWALWRVVPESVEFWQAAPDRDHTRIVFTSDGARWTRTVGGGEATPRRQARRASGAATVAGLEEA